VIDAGSVNALGRKILQYFKGIIYRRAPILYIA